MELLALVGLIYLISKGIGFIRGSGLKDRAMDNTARAEVYCMSHEEAEETRTIMSRRYVDILLSPPSGRPSFDEMQQLLYIAAAAQDRIHELEGMPHGYHYRTAIRRRLLIAAHQTVNAIMEGKA